MAFSLSEILNEVRIYDERTQEHQVLYARDPSPKEQLAYDRERAPQKRGRTINKVYQTRLKYGCAVLEKAQEAATAKDEGYGFQVNGQWQPLTPDAVEVPVDSVKLKAEYAATYGADWCKWMDELPPWKLLLLAQAPQHVERVASVVFEGAAEHKQLLADQLGGGDDEEDEEGN